MVMCVVIHRKLHLTLLTWVFMLTVNDCSFEDGWCGWHNYEDDLVAERKLWEVYTCSSKRHGRFNGQERDHTYERGTGNYDTL